MSIPANAVRVQLHKLLASPQLSQSEALAKLLRFVVEETLVGRGEQLKEERLGLEVFGRRPSHYDTAIDPIVRVQMGRLRHRLRQYYDQSADPIVIDIPKGRYTPEFTRPAKVQGPASSTRHPPPLSPRAPRIAVLPFVNMSGAPDTEYFSDGLTDELIHVLARDPQLQVVARTSSFQFKQQARDIREIGRQLEVGNVLEGSVRQSGSRVRVTVQLIDAADGCHLWSERYDRELTDIFAIHDEIAAAVHHALRTRLVEHSRTAAPMRRTGLLEAYNEYLRGRCLWNQRTAGALRAAIAHFTAAVKLDPRFARALSGMADAYLLLGLSGAEPPERALPQARAAVERALELDPELAEAHASLAAIHGVYDRDVAAAHGGFLRAEALDPNYATAHHWKALFSHATRGEFDAAFAAQNLAVELDPLAAPIIADLGLLHCLVGQHDGVVTACERALELDPHFHRPYWFLGLSLATHGAFAAAETALQRALFLCPDEAFQSRIIGTLGYCQGRAGNRRAAEARLGELAALSAKRYVPRWDFAQIHAGLGDAHTTVAELTTAAAGRETYAIFTGVWPTLRELHGDPRFTPLVSPWALAPRGNRCPAPPAPLP